MFLKILCFFSKIDALREVFLDVLDEVDDEEAVAERLIIIPSPPGDESDEYSGDEEALPDLNHLPVARFSAGLLLL